MAVQTEIPGTEHKSQDKQLNEMMEGRRKTSKSRKRWQDREVDEGAAIERYMAEKGLTIYVNKNHVPPLVAKLKAKSKLVLEEYDDGSTDDSDEGDDDGAKYAEMADQKATKKKPVLSEA